MKLILFADKLPPEIGGMETHANYFVQRFSKENDLTIISSKGGCNVIVDNSFQAIKDIELFDFLKSFKNDKCVIFYNSGYWIESFIAIRALLNNAVFIYRTGGNEISQAPLSLRIDSHSKRQEYWVSVINKSIDYLIANSQFTSQRLIDLGIHKRIIKIISGGVDLSNVQKAIKQKSQTRRQLNCSEHDPLVVCCCRFVPYKRIDFLLRAFRYLPQHYKIVLVGDGELLDSTIVLANKMNLNIQFLGKLTHEETLSIIAAASIYCQASSDLIVNVKGGWYVHTEGMGRSLIESICCGVRVVVTICGAIDEFINSENGTLVKGDEVQFAHQIESSLTLPIIGELIRQSYCEKYSFENIFSQYERLWY